MSSSSENSRPNIRIQISNNTPENAEEKMEIDADENEEGEIIDENSYPIEDTEEIPKALPSATFTTGINIIFDKNEQEKLQERAKRFALKPEEIHVITEQDLNNLHDSLGINSVNESEIKFDTVHVLGLQDMSAEDIVNYFCCYAPEGIEWIDDKSCNLVWLENMSAARAMHFKSRPVKGMPARETTDLFPQEFLDITEEPLLEEADGQSILIKNQHREVQLQNDIGEVILPRKKLYLENAADISEITIPIPPGFWRLGEFHPKSTCLLIRYGKVSDKLPFKTEKCSKYLKKFPNSKLWTFEAVKFPAKNKEVKTLFERNKDLNPWASLARNWDKDSKFREKEPTLPESDEIKASIEVKNPSLMARLGTKRKVEEEKIEEVEEKLKITTSKKITKMPRMRMYADEEEENQKRRKILKSIKKQAEEIEKRDKPGDLRNMLGPTNKQLRQDTPKIEPEFDLGMKLKNRSQKMIFAVERDPFEEILFGRTLYSDIDSEFAKSPANNKQSKHHHHDHREERRSRSSVRLHHDHHHHHHEDVRDRLSERKERFSSSRQHSTRRSPVRTLHSDRIYENRRRTRSSEFSSRTGKPRSKVAVVVRPEIKPTVASTIWSKVSKSSSSETESSDESSSSSTSSESGSDSEDSNKKRNAANNRPGFDKSRLSQRVQPNNDHHRSPLKITTSNEHFSRSRLRN